MGKNEARALVGEPTVTAAQTEVAFNAAYVAEVEKNAQLLGDLAARALAGGAAMAREYAAAAGELCRTADRNPNTRAGARRLLRLALAHLET